MVGEAGDFANALPEVKSESEVTGPERVTSLSMLRLQLPVLPDGLHRESPGTLVTQRSGVTYCCKLEGSGLNQREICRAG
jgi:hypothetical protein